MKMKKIFSATAMVLAAAFCFGGCAPKAAEAVGEAAPASDSIMVMKADSSAEPDTPVVPEGDRPNELVISLGGENAFVNEAAEKYMAAHEDVKIAVQPIGTANNRDGYTQQVSTELMGGTGADIYDAMFLSYCKLADSGLLADLNEYIGGELASDKFTAAIVDSLLYNGKRYTVPLSYNFTAFQADQAVAEEYGIQIPDGNLTLYDLMSFSEQLPDDDSVLLMSGGGSGMNDMLLAEALVGNSFNEFVNLPDKVSDFENDNFYGIISGVSYIVENGQLPSSKGSTGDSKAITASSVGSTPAKALLHPYMMYQPAMTHNGTVDFAGMKLLTNDSGTAAFSTTSFLPVVSANSSNKELAGDFIKFLLSDEMQSSTALLFCPVNKTAIESNSQFIYEDSKAGGYLPEGFTEDTLQQNIKTWADLSENLDTCDRKEREVNSLVWDSLGTMFSEGGTAEQAASRIQAAVNLYLGE